ncbi:MAG: TrkH family potassium uptake protein, partial [Clostridia bacterium]|nr:TrkH family potassium uptake protein [Clostridia bacterium]
AAPCLLIKPRNTRIFAKEGFVVVALAWILLSAFGALPFVFDGAIPHYVDALFETVSGFTTTGATIMPDLDAVSRSILMWRAFTHWVGGMGVLVFMMALIPSEGGRNIHLLRAEVPGPTKGKLVPRLRRTALILYAIYFVLTVIELCALLIAGLDFYDALITAFSTAGTGGFGVLNNSIAGYQSPAVEWITAIFMLLFGTNFNIYFFILIGKVREIFKNSELRVYLALTLVFTAAITLNTLSMYDAVGDAIRTAFFTVTSTMSTTGFVLTDYGLWPSFSKALVIVMMVIGASAGSTAGGMKVSRVMILFKNMFRELKHMLRPNSVNRIKMDGDSLEEETVRSAGNYLAMYAVILVASFVLVSLDNMSIETNLTAVLTCLNNVGPVMGTITPFGNLSSYSILSKLVLTLDMLFGRLEFLPMFILFSPGTYRKN